jgi:predicted ATPase
VDHRADLYALGATLYELAVGEPPFGFGDPLRLVHDHLVRMPVAPAEIDPGVPAPLSQVVMRLLEKEPDRRYQTAEGVGHDLERLRAAGSAPKAAQFRLGERDVPVRLLPPSRMVGRESELAALEAAFEDAMAGRCRAVLVSGGPGVGKTTLVDELRPVVTRRSGWLVAGKFDQYRRDLEFDAVNQAFRALGRLLLAEPEAELVAARERILDEAGPSAGILVAALPEFATLLAVPPDPGDPLTAHMRAARAGLAVVRAAASVKRPLVLFLDDLQWVGPTPLRFVELVLSEEPVEGLLLVGAYRPAGVDGAHPLAAPLSRWGEQADVRQLRLENLASPDVIAMISEMLRLDPVAAAPLAESIGSQTSGNPYEIVEVLNALRRDHVLTPTSGGWTWDAATVRAHLDGSETAGPSLSRGRAMPVESRHLVEAMACLGGRADPTLLQVAIDQPAVRVERTMASALEAGVLVVEPGPRQTVRFRHDRTRDAILDGLDAEERRVLQLAMARRLAKVPELFAVAAEQYLPAVDAIADPAERRHAVTLLRRAADQAALIGDYPLVCALLTAAVRLIDPRETSTLAEVHVARHVALFSLGKLDEADEEYAAIERLSASAIQRAGATVVQLYSLVNRTRFAEASALGLAALGELGISVPVAGRLSA